METEAKVVCLVEEQIRGDWLGEIVLQVGLEEDVLLEDEGEVDLAFHALWHLELLPLPPQM